MRNRLLILVLMIALSGCRSARPVAEWHRRIPQVATTQPHDAADPETGLLLWKDFADQDFPFPLSRETAFQILLNTETFADAHVGYSGAKSLQVEAFQVLLTQPDARAVFTDLLKRGNTAGKLYALCAYYLIAPEQYAAAEHDVLRSAATVDQQAGCVTGGESVQEIVRSSEPNAVRLRRGETVKQWFDRVKPTGQGVMFDISGGTLPETYRDAQ